MDPENTQPMLKPKKKFLGITITKKKIIWTIITLLIILLIGFRIFKPKDNSANIQTDKVKKQDIKATVLATGQVVSNTDLNLSFKTSGVISKINVKVGDKIKAGSVLATLSQNDVQASLTSAAGTLAQARANYEKVLAGASSQDIDVSQKALDAAQVALNTAKNNFTNTQAQQTVAVSNAYNSLLNSSLAAVSAQNNSGSAVLTISGAYTGSDQGVYNVSIYNTGSGQIFQTTGLENSSGPVKNTSVPLGSKGLFIQFSGTANSSDTWTITIPNTMASNYVANYNAYQTALKSQKSAVDAAQAQVDSANAALAQAQANLAAKQAQARPADIAAAQAQILSAQGQVQAASAAVENTVIRAPADGTITSVDKKVGELASALQEVLILQDVTNLHVEANVSEASISNLQPDQTVDLTFDALGPDRHFAGVVQTVNPGATIVSGVVNYKVTASITAIPEVKPGMTANMTVLVSEKKSVLTLPTRAIINQDSKKYVRVIDDIKKKTYHQVEVKVGIDADGGLTEVTSGLTEGQEVVTYIKQ
jgi:HlyD family secretion protein